MDKLPPTPPPVPGTLSDYSRILTKEGKAPRSNQTVTVSSPPKWLVKIFGKNARTGFVNSLKAIFANLFNRITASGSSHKARVSPLVSPAPSVSPALLRQEQLKRKAQDRMQVLIANDGLETILNVGGPTAKGGDCGYLSSVQQLFPDANNEEQLQRVVRLRKELHRLLGELFEIRSPNTEVAESAYDEDANPEEMLEMSLLLHNSLSLAHLNNLYTNRNIQLMAYQQQGDAGLMDLGLSPFLALAFNRNINLYAPQYDAPIVTTPETFIEALDEHVDADVVERIRNAIQGQVNWGDFGDPANNGDLAITYNGYNHFEAAVTSKEASRRREKGLDSVAR